MIGPLLLTVLHLPRPITLASSAAMTYVVVPVVSQTEDAEGRAQPLWRFDGRDRPLPVGFSPVAASSSPPKLLLYENAEDRFVLVGAEGKVRPLPASREWYGLTQGGKLLSLSYSSGRFVVRCQERVIARSGPVQRGYDTVESPRIVSGAGGIFAVGYDSGRRATAKGQHAIDTAVYSSSGRCIRTLRNVTPQAFIGEHLIVNPYSPFEMQPEVGTSRLVNVATGRSLKEFRGAFAVTESAIVGLTLGKGPYVAGATPIWPASLRGARLRVGKPFEPGPFLTRIRLVAVAEEASR